MCENNWKNGFTLVELLAVLIILSVILVIAVPRIMGIINDVRKSTLESTAKLIASSAEKKKIENEIMGTDEILTCSNVVKINDIDYEKCYIEFIDNKALVTIIGSGNFKGMNVCDASKNEVSIASRCLNKKVEVTIELNNNDISEKSGIYKEGTIIDLGIPEKENATFNSWKVVSGNSTILDNKLTVGSENSIIYAMYDSWPTLTIDFDGGSGTDKSGIYKTETIIDLEVPTKTGHTFKGWEVKEGNGVVSGIKLTMGSVDTIVKATYDLSVYKVTFNPSGGIVNTEYKNVTYSDTYGEMPIPVKEGYMFIGWYNEKNKEVISSDKVEILSDIELNAKYIKNEFAYTGNYETFIVPKEGNYKIELWGAEGGAYIEGMGGKGAYTSGIILLLQNDKLYINIGEKGKKADKSGTLVSVYNGGGVAYYEAGTGGGSSDIRIIGTNIIDRIMVAAGGGGSGMFFETMYGGDAGGLNGYDGVSHVSETYTNRHSGAGASQIAGGLAGEYWTGEKRENSYLGTNGNFGIGGNGGYEINNSETSGYKNGAGAGGGGYYGGGGGTERNGAGGGGSSFISGHNGCNAISENSTQNNPIHTGQSVHFSGYKFTNTIMIDGKGYNWTNGKGNYIGMPSHDGKSTMTGNSGNGYAKITYMGKE